MALGHGGGAVAGDGLPLEHAVAVAAPAPEQAVDHAHGAHHLGVAQAHLGEVVVAAGGVVGLGERVAHEPLVGQRHDDQHHRRAERERRRGAGGA